MKPLVPALLFLLLCACGAGTITQDAVTTTGSESTPTAEETVEVDVSEPVNPADGLTPDVDTETSNGDVNACSHTSIAFFSSIEAGISELMSFCGSRLAYAQGVRLAHSELDWGTKALYAMIAANSAYFDYEVDLAVASQLQTEAYLAWQGDLELTARIRENRSSEEDRFIATTLLGFDYALLISGDNRDVQRHFSLWEITADSSHSDLSEAMLILLEFIRYGNMWAIAQRVDNDPALKEAMEPINTVF